MRTLLLLLLPLWLLAVPVPAAALCSSASLEQEYREADVVVRARIVAETRVMDDAPSAATRARWGDYFPVVLYRLRVVELFKGRPGPEISFFDEVNSGQFPIDLDRDYLLFFHYHRSAAGYRLPAAARGAMYVRYTCSQSRAWSLVQPAVVGRLRQWARRR